MKISKNAAFRLLIAPLLVFGLVEASSASTCTAIDVVIFDGVIADDCGTGDPYGLTVTGNSVTVANTPITPTGQLPDDYMGWDVNQNGDGGSSDWQYYYKQDLGSPADPDGIFPDISFGADGINLQILNDGGNDNRDTGDFSFNAYGEPVLIVLGDGSDGGVPYEYTWYLFLGLDGPQTGSWDTSSVFGGKDLSNITVYENDESFPPVPVPAAVWLFGSGLIGLVGIARRRRKA